MNTVLKRKEYHDVGIISTQMLVFEMANDSTEMTRLFEYISTTFTYTTQAHTVTIRCAEWCGSWAAIEFIKHLLTFEYNTMYTLNGNRTNKTRTNCF